MGGSENDGSQSHHGFKYSNEDARKCFLCLKLSISEILNESWGHSQYLTVIFFITVRFYSVMKQVESSWKSATCADGNSSWWFINPSFLSRWTPREPETFRRWACKFTRQNNQHVPVLPPDLSPDCNFLGLHFCDLNIFEYQYRVDIQDV